MVNRLPACMGLVHEIIYSSHDRLGVSQQKSWLPPHIFVVHANCYIMPCLFAYLQFFCKYEAGFRKTRSWNLWSRERFYAANVLCPQSVSLCMSLFYPCLLCLTSTVDSLCSSISAPCTGHHDTIELWCSAQKGERESEQVQGSGWNTHTSAIHLEKIKTEDVCTPLNASLLSVGFWC